MIRTRASALRRLAAVAGFAIALPLMSSCASTLPVPPEILAEYERGRPIIRLPLRYADGQPLRGARSYAGRFRDNGQIYMVGRGRFRLGPETLLCIYNTEVEPAAQTAWRDSRVLERISEQVRDGIDEFIARGTYSGRRDEFMLDPDREVIDRQACATSSDVVNIHSRALVGRAPRRYLFEVDVEQGGVFSTYFLERNLQRPLRETVLAPLPADWGDGEDIVGDDTRFLGMMIGYFTRTLSE